MVFLSKEHVLNANFQSIWDTLDVLLDENQGMDLTRTVASYDDQLTHRFYDTLPIVMVGEEESDEFIFYDTLGEGGMGVVRLAEQKTLEREVAIKSARSAQTTSVEVTSLLQEARAMGYVEHPNIVPVHMIGRDTEGLPMIVMKRIQGNAWDHWITQDPQQSETIEFHLNVVIALSRALAYAHSRGIIHRDIKPANVMIGSFGEIYLLDWGLAVSIDPKVEHIPQAEHAHGLVGTPLYMAPEMTTGNGRLLSKQTDIYLLGASLYHVLTGVPPHQGNSLYETLQHAYEGHPRSYPDRIPEELRLICERAMALRPEDRFEDAEALQRALNDFLTHRNSHELTHQADMNLSRLDATSDDERSILFNEICFGYRAALHIWSDNHFAQTGLRKAKIKLINLELEQGHLELAQQLILELDPPPQDLVERINIQVAHNQAHQAQLEKLKYDQDENVGLKSRYRFMLALALTFIISPFLVRATRGQITPQWLHGITKDAELLATNAISLLFLPVFIWSHRYTQKNLWEHKTSRVFVKGTVTMYIPGVMVRMMSLSGEVPLNYAICAESAVYGASLMQLALSLDRRLGPSSIAFFLTSLILVFTNLPPLETFSAGSIVACLAFLSYDRWRRGKSFTPIRY